MVKIIMKDNSIIEFEDYSSIAIYRGEEVIFYEEVGSYQGDWFMISKTKDGIYNFWRDGYGSCSGCDDFQATFSYYGKNSQETADKFVYAYSPEYSLKKEEITIEILENWINKERYTFISNGEKNKFMKSIIKILELNNL